MFRGILAISRDSWLLFALDYFGRCMLKEMEGT